MLMRRTTHANAMPTHRYEAPNFGDDMHVGDTTVGEGRAGGAFDDADPDFGKETPHTSRVRALLLLFTLLFHL